MTFTSSPPPADRNGGNTNEQFIQNKVRSDYNTANCTVVVVCGFDITDPKEGSVNISYRDN
jgi:hypothetical protein